MNAKKCILIFFVAFSNTIFPQTQLILSEIMKGEDFIGELPDTIFWAENSESIYFNWNPDNDIVRSCYKVDLKGLTPYKVGIEELRSLPSKDGTYSRDKNKKLYEKNGDIFMYDTKSGKELPITNTVESESDPVFTMDDRHVVYRLKNNLFRISLENVSLKQLTHFTANIPADKPEEISAQKQWIRDEEIGLFDVLQERKEKKERTEAGKKLLKIDQPVKIPLNGRSLKTAVIGPDEQFVIYLLVEKELFQNNTEVPEYITESGYVEMQKARPKAGSPEPTMQLGIYNVEKDTSFIVSTENLPGIYDKPEFLKDYWNKDSPYTDQYDSPREVYFLRPVFNTKGDRAALVIRSMDNKDRWIASLDLDTGSLFVLDRQHDECWIGGPGIKEWKNEEGTLGWLADDETVWFQSEESGYSHVYTFNARTKVRKAITEGNWEVYKVQLSNDKDYFYITANREGPAERHFYRVPVSGGPLTRYTQDPGNYEVFLSPNEKMLAIRYSYSNQPWELYIMPNKPGAKMHQITHSTTDAFNSYPWRDPEIIQFAARDQDTVYARLYRPSNTNEKGPAVIFVHGAGYLQNVHRWWSQYYREYMFHNFLADQGYTVLDIDYRGSEGYGRKWRTGVYRHMGGKDLTDQVDGVKFLIEHYNIDADRVGIYGGSYGGFITIFAMFKYPEIFRCGAALRSVTDWAHYNHPYTSNRLNTPAEDSLAYRRSSPIYYADGLKGPLIMLHGMADTNVHFQDVVRLSQKLIELGKSNWDIAVYPMEDHGFKESSSWADEYRRIFELFEENLK